MRSPPSTRKMFLLEFSPPCADRAAGLMEELTVFVSKPTGNEDYPLQDSDSTRQRRRWYHLVFVHAFYRIVESVSPRSLWSLFARRLAPPCGHDRGALRRPIFAAGASTTSRRLATTHTG